MTIFDPNDERITAYILGDDSLSADDRAAVAELLKKNPEAQRFADELRAAADLAGMELAAEPIPALAPTANIEAAVRKEFARPKAGSWNATVRWCVAASLLVGMGFYFVPKIQERQLAMAVREVDPLGSAPSDAKMMKPASGGFTAGNKGGYGSVFGEMAWKAANESREGGGERGAMPSPMKADDFVEGDRTRVLAAKSEPAAGDRLLRDLYAAMPAEKDVRNKLLEERNTSVDAATLLAQQKAVEAEVLKRETPLAFMEKAAPADAKPPTDGKDFYRYGVDVKSADPSAHPVPAIKSPAPSQLQGLNEEAARRSNLADGIEADRLATLRNPAPRSFALGGRGGFNTEAYPVLKENDFLTVNAQNALSTFSTDVDTASYSLVRKFLNQNTLPPPGAVRLEEMVNYFRYNYTPPTGEHPFAANLEIAECPWNPQNRLARIAIKGKVIDESKRPPSNLVFLIDVSGSMNEPNKLPLVKDGLKLLVDKLGENDRVGIAVYASGSGLVLDSTIGSKKSDIMYAIDNLQPSGSTNGAAGIKCAYDAAVKGFIKGGTNRVILCTDGDFNVGVSSDDELVALITEKAKSGVFLSVLGFGEGNFKDAKMMGIANKGNGNYAYIDSVKEAQKVLVEQMSGTLVTIAKDVKIQVEWNPAKVGSYRLLGYEKRMLKAEDFKDDKKDAGEIGAGHTVTALYELTPPGMSTPASKTEPLVFQKPAEPAKVSPELANAVGLVRLRYKQPEGSTSTEVSFPAKDEGKKYTQASEDFRFAAAAASFAMILRDSPYKGNATLSSVHELAQAAKGQDPSGYRAEFIKLIEKAKELKK
jgi:Ca-activated chloride channel family protein